MQDTSILEINHAPEQEISNPYGISESECINLEVEQPVRVKDLMKELDLSFLEPILDELYSENWRFKFNPITILKTIIYW